MTNDILIFAEQRNDNIHLCAVQIVTPARALAKKTGGKVVACLIGDSVDASAVAMEQAGVDGIITVCDPALANYSALRYRTALAAAIASAAPRVVLLARAASKARTKSCELGCRPC